jgi:ribosomal protein S12 methylthiotransferase
VGCFVYSPVSQARANSLPDPVDPELAHARRDELMALQADISHARLARRIGSRCTVLVDEVNGAEIVARSAGESPDVDGVVRLPATEGVAVGDRLSVEITGCDAYDLTATLLEFEP